MIIKSKKYFLPAIILLLLTISIFVFTKQRQPVYPQALCKDCNVILITMTNLRYDHMSSNGYFRPTTPNLDKLAKESLVFDNAFSHASWTLPEAISTYTSLYPYQHGVMNRHDGSKVSKEIPTLIDLLSENGYKTAGFTGGFDYNPQFGLTDRFDKYEECAEIKGAVRLPGIRTVGPDVYGQFGCTIPKAIGWLRENATKKFFLHVQGYDAHCPFSQRGGETYDAKYNGGVNFSDCFWTPEKKEAEVINGNKYYSVFSSKGATETSVLLNEQDIYHLVALYDESINFADQEIGILLEEIKKMGLYDKTIIVFTSEHGDMLGENGQFMRGGSLHDTFYEDVLHIPLIIEHPKLSPKRITGLVGHIDVAPTILRFLGFTPSYQMKGKNLSPLILDNIQVNSEIFAGITFIPNSFRPYLKKTQVAVVRDSQWKLIAKTIFGEYAPETTVELYDIVNDENESENLSNVNYDIKAKLQPKLNDWLEGVGGYVFNQEL